MYLGLCTYYFISGSTAHVINKQTNELVDRRTGTQKTNRSELQRKLFEYSAISYCYSFSIEM